MSLPPESSERAVEAGTQVGPPTLLTEFSDYEEAQRAIDTLSDQGFPVAATSIVWNRLRRVEHVTGRKLFSPHFETGRSAVPGLVPSSVSCCCSSWNAQTTVPAWRW